MARVNTLGFTPEMIEIIKTILEYYYFMGVTSPSNKLPLADGVLWARDTLVLKAPDRFVTAGAEGRRL